MSKSHNIKVGSIEDYKYYIDSVDLIESGKGTSGMSGGPLCYGCNPYLKDCSHEEIEHLKQLMRDCKSIDSYCKELLVKYGYNFVDGTKI